MDVSAFRWYIGILACMGLSLSASVHWAVSSLIEAGLFGLALRRNLFSRLPFFTIYLGLVLASEPVLWLTYHFAGIATRTSADVYWIAQVVLITARAAAVYDIFHHILGPYKGVWKFCRRFLIALGVALTIATAASTSNGSHFIVTRIFAAQRGLELMVLSILVLGLIFSRYYGVAIDRYVALMMLGLGFYSAVEFANNTFLRLHISWARFPIWENLHLASFNIATLLWCIALLRPLPEQQLSPALMQPGDYETLAPQMSAKLRQLNSALMDLWK
jgi:hypothetical protein